MKLEDFLKKWGLYYSLRIVSKRGEILHINIQSQDIDGDETSQDFCVIDNHVFPI